MREQAYPDCKHCRFVRRLPLLPWHCTHPEATFTQTDHTLAHRGIVTKKVVHARCSTLRLTPAICGHSAKLFEPKAADA